MPFGKDGEFYLFHQRDTRRPEPFGEPFGWSLVTTKDFVTYKDMGEVLPSGGDSAQDQFIFAGSVFEADKKYHAFYTGYNRNYPKLGKPSQVLMHATSKNLICWEKENEALLLNPQPGYDSDNWRDPFVLYDEEKKEYLLILGARRKNNDQLFTGCTVKFTSKDLKNWKFEEEFWAPHIYIMHEMPDLFRIGDWWYLIISEYSDRNKTFYRMSHTLEGPWLAPMDDAFDGRAYYAGRTFCLNGQRILFGWVPTKENNSDLGNFQWGGTFVAHEVYQHKDGSLGVKPPDTVWNAFPPGERVPDVSIRTIDCRKEIILARDCGDLFRFEADVVFKKGTRNFAIKLLENEKTGEGYQFVFAIGENRYYFEKTPNYPWYQCMNIGLERPIIMEADEILHIRLIVDDTIATLYVNDVALNTRMYTTPGECLGVYVTDGALDIKNILISRQQLSPIISVESEYLS